jgi:hypothetical protein
MTSYYQYRKFMEGGEDVGGGLLGCEAVLFVNRYQRFGGKYCLHLQANTILQSYIPEDYKL